MQKIVIYKPGGHERLKIESCPDPEPKDGEVLVAVKAIGVNYADCMVRMGLYASAKKYVGWPITPGFEFAGVVKQVGQGVEKWQEGMEVFGVTRFGAYTTDVIAAGHQIFKLPEGIKLEEAAAFPAVALTAYYALYELVKLRPGMKVLVHSAAGGVGTSALQMAKVAGCFVVGVVRGSHKVEVAKTFGADKVIDKSRENLWQMAEQYGGDGYDVILDANGVETLKQSYNHLKPTGKLVVYGFHTMLKRGKSRPSYLKLILDYFRTPKFNPLNMTGDNKSVLAFNLSYLFDHTEYLAEGMEQLVSWIEDKKILPHKVTCYPFVQAGKAHKDLESGTSVGKLVLMCEEKH